MGLRGVYFEGRFFCMASCIWAADMMAPGSTSSVTTLLPCPSRTDTTRGGGVKASPIPFSRCNVWWTSCKLLALRTLRDVDGRPQEKGSDIDGDLQDEVKTKILSINIMTPVKSRFSMIIPDEHLPLDDFWSAPRNMRHFYH